MKLSIIVPIYNVEEFIVRCAESLINQTASDEDYEVIFVNDGTKDNSIDVLRGAIDFNQQKNIRIVEKTNGGLSSARNYGVEHSKGDYIWFVDSDDWVEPDSVEYLISKMYGSPDVIVTTQMYVNQGIKQTLKYPNDADFEGTGSTLMDICRPDCAVLYICQRNYLSKWGFRFYEGILHEDSEITPRILYLAEKCVATKKPLYHYFMREGSIMHVVSPKRIHSYFVVLRTLIEFSEKVVSDSHKKIFAKACVPHIYGLLDVSKDASSDLKAEVNKFFVDKPQLSAMMKLVPDKKANIFGRLIGKMPSCTCSIYKLLLKLQGR